MNLQGKPKETVPSQWREEMNLPLRLLLPVLVLLTFLCSVLVMGVCRLGDALRDRWK